MNDYFQALQLRQLETLDKMEKKPNKKHLINVYRRMYRFFSHWRLVHSTSDDEAIGSLNGYLNSLLKVVFITVYHSNRSYLEVNHEQEKQLSEIYKKIAKEEERWKTNSIKFE